MPVHDFLEQFRSYWKCDPVGLRFLADLNLPATNYEFRDGLLYYRHSIFVPQITTVHNKILHDCHATPTGGHAGVKRTMSRLCLSFYWPKMQSDVHTFIQHCATCQHVKYSTKPPLGLLQPLPIPALIWEDLSMDFITGLPQSGGKTYIMVFVDRLSKAAHFIALPSSLTAAKLALIFCNEVVRLHGLPKSIVSDRDPLFISKFWSELFRLQGTTLALSSAYHPQSDGQTEVLNRCLEDYLRCFVLDEPCLWSKFLPWAEWSYNTAWQSTIKMSPFEAVYGGRPPSVPHYVQGSSSSSELDLMLTQRTAILSLLKANLARAQNRMSQLANKHRLDKSFQVGYMVLVKLQPYRQHTIARRQSHKLAKRFYGPFPILAKVGSVAYKLQLPPDARTHPVFHVSLLRKFEGHVTSEPDMPAYHVSSFLVPEAILDKSPDTADTPQVLVKWFDLPQESATWISLSEFMRVFPTFDLEDKVSLDARGPDTTQAASSTTYSHQRPKRVTQLPKSLQDYHM